MIIHKNNSLAVKNKVIGGKAKHLLSLTNNGFNVPAWVVIPEDFFSEILKGLNINPLTLSVDELQAQIKEIKFPNTLIRKIKEVLQIQEGKYYAVRSSASDEDGVASSFAGQYDSYLFVKPQDIEENIIKVWLSAFSEHILTYRKENELKPNYYVSVIIQEMIDSDVSGVAFGANPVTGNRKERIISTVYGLGEGLVSGELNADNYTVLGENVTEDIVIKDRALKYYDNKLDYFPVNEREQEVSSLTNEQVKQVAKVLEEIKDVFNLYQDIEFAFHKEELFILQARPITNIHKLADQSTNHQLWDNSNIIESYPGINSPLTFSFIIKMYESVYIQFCDLMGVDKKKIKDNDQVFANMLGIINGKVYYNLKNWYKVLSLFPGYAINKRFMESMMGVKEPIQEEETLENTDSKFKSYRKLFGSVRKMIKEFRTVKKNRNKFLGFTKEVFAKYDAINYDQLSASETMNHYMAYEKILLEEWRAPLINDFFAMIFFGLLKKKTEELVPENPNIANDLLIGSNDIISVEPVVRLAKIRGLIHSDKMCYDFFKSNTTQAIFNNLKNFPKVHEEIIDYIKVFGDRCTGELKLETKTYSTEPLDFIELVKDQLDVEVDIEHIKANGLKIRKEAEETVFSKLKGKWLKKKIFNYQLKKTRELVSQRENLRFERTRGFGYVRKMFNGIGKAFYAEGVINQPEDIFCLTQEEIFDFVRGTSVNKNLKSLIELRKAEYKTYTKYDTDERFSTHGITYVGNEYKNTTVSNEKGDLEGIGCSPGIVEHEVKIVNSPKEIKNLEGKIMVCESTDPGWVTLFPTCSAIIVERGSLLSHSAIVSREMGVPCIVGVTNVLQKLKDGDKVKMNGSTGQIELVNLE